jgi:hypothetical protein
MPTIRLSDDRSLIIRERLWGGNISNIFDATLCDTNPVAKNPKKIRNRYERVMDQAVAGDTRSVLVKVAKQPYYNDLLERDVVVLGQLHPAEQGVKDRSFPKYYPASYGGVLIDGLQGHILGRIENCITLADVLRAYPDGIDYRDMAWMLKRVLVGLWFAHKRGIIHGAVLPQHILLTLPDHGGRLIDWSYSTNLRFKIPVMNTEYEDYYPPEVLNSEPAREGTDLFMAVKCVQALLGGDLKTKEFPDSVPEPIKNLLTLCLNDSVHMRPIDSSEVHDTFDRLLKEIVGKPTFRPFSLPDFSSKGLTF